MSRRRFYIVRTPKRRFRIVHRQYFDEKAVQKSEHWIVEEWRKLWIFYERWRPLKHIESDETGTYSSITEFSSVAEANYVIGVLRDGRPIDEWTSEVVEQDE